MLPHCLLLIGITISDVRQECSPATEVRIALDDLRERVPSLHYADTRYLTLYSLPRESWPDAAAVVSFVLNSVSRSAVMLTKRLLYHMDGMTFDAALQSGADLNAVARMTEDCRQGIAKFLKKS